MIVTTTDRRSGRRKVITILLSLILCMAMLFPAVVRAEGTYYATWDAYTAGTGLEDATWNHVVDAMEEVLDASVAAYESGDADAAYKGVNDAYYGYYETTGFERVAMGYISGARKSEMELQFSACKSVAKKGGTTEAFQTEVETLKSMLRQDANILDGTTGESSDTSENGDTLATELFAQNYYSTWETYKSASGLETPTWNDVVDAMVEVLNAAKETYAGGDADGAYKGINDAYYGYYETTGFERVAMGYISGARKSEMELQFSACKSVTKNNGSADAFDAEVDTLRSMLRQDANILDGTTDNDSGEEESGSDENSGTRSAAVAAFVACFTILLREGFEAILVVGAIIAYLLKAGNSETDKKKQVRPVYIGAVLGIVASFLSAWVLNQLKLANSASQEVIEGVTALIAVVVLYWVSNWMVSKSESEAWSAYIKSKVKSSSEKGSTFALAFTAFLAVYREGAEVILFYQPMLAGDNINMVWAGFAAGCVSLVFVYLAIRVLSIRIPLKPFFLGTSILMFIMSIAFLGSGIKELIEGDVITMSSPAWVAWIPSNSLLEILGIYPCVQTVVPQLILLAVTIVIFILQLRRNKRLREEAQKEAEAAS
ncbi:MAG: FTR1 family iron permease [Lachnospiraceae bacterium]|nr:FTR1 family iron permease [Lachnospiraceae bacterium]